MVPNGDIMVCRRLGEVIGNVFDCENIANIYYENQLVKELYYRNFIGKCGTCSKKQICGGGCRAYVLATKNNVLEYDELCFLQ